MSTKEYTQEPLPRAMADMWQTIPAPQALADPYRHAETMLAERTHLLALSTTVGAALAGNDSLRTSLQRCAEALVQHLGVAAACIWTLDTEAKVLRMQASAGVYTPLGNIHGSVRVGESAVGVIARECQPYVTNTVLDDTGLPDKAWAQRTGVTAFAGYPLVVEDRLMGVMAMFARQPFTPAMLKVFLWVARVMAMGIDRMCISDALARSMAKVVRMNKRLRHQNAELNEFTYAAGHNLQEPLHQLMTCSNMLRKDLGDNLPERAEKDLDSIVDTATHIHTLLQALLDPVPHSLRHSCWAGCD
jgi:transcriptional regulator with GAF, ATPase, and Fis domain